MNGQQIAKQIANHLQVNIAAIKNIQEWKHVYFVTFFGAKARFVSKKVVKTQETYRVVAVGKQVRKHGYYGTLNRGIRLQSMNEGNGQIEKFWVNQTNLNVQLHTWDVVTAEISNVANFAVINLA